MDPRFILLAALPFGHAIDFEALVERAFYVQPYPCAGLHRLGHELMNLLEIHILSGEADGDELFVFNTDHIMHKDCLPHFCAFLPPYPTRIS